MTSITDAGWVLDTKCGSALNATDENVAFRENSACHQDISTRFLINSKDTRFIWRYALQRQMYSGHGRLCAFVCPAMYSYTIAHISM